jgi:hypothetical protein
MSLMEVTKGDLDEQQFEQGLHRTYQVVCHQQPMMM